LCEKAVYIGKRYERCDERNETSIVVNQRGEGPCKKHFESERDPESRRNKQFKKIINLSR